MMARHGPHGEILKMGMILPIGKGWMPWRN